MKIKERLLNAFGLKGGLAGLKLIIGAALIVLSHELLAIKDLIPLYPDAEILQTIANWIQHIIDFLSKILGYLGDGFLGIGALDKLRKMFFLPKP